MKSQEVRFVWMFVFFDLPVGTKADRPKIEDDCVVADSCQDRWVSLAKRRSRVVCRSEWHTPAAAMRISTSPARGASMAASRTASRP